MGGTGLEPVTPSLSSCSHVGTPGHDGYDGCMVERFPRWPRTRSYPLMACVVCANCAHRVRACQELPIGGSARALMTGRRGRGMLPVVRRRRRSGPLEPIPRAVPRASRRRRHLIPPRTSSGAPPRRMFLVARVERAMMPLSAATTIWPTLEPKHVVPRASRRRRRLDPSRAPCFWCVAPPPQTCGELLPTPPQRCGRLPMPRGTRD